MADQNSGDVTQLLAQWRNGDRDSLDRLMPLVYQELRLIASRFLRHERPGHTLQSTALVNEAFLRLVNQQDVQWRNRAHFFGIAAQMIRRILVDHARAAQADKRGAGAVRIELEDHLAVSSQSELDLVGLDECLQKLAALDERQARIVELRFFTGLSVEETAEVMQVSTATVKREWSSARAWLFREMTRE